MTLETKCDIMCVGNIKPRDVKYFDCKECPIDKNQKYKPCYVRLEVPRKPEITDEELECEAFANYNLIIGRRK